MIYDESSEVNENELKKIIEKAVVSDAITVYDLLNKKGIGNFTNIIFIVNIYFNFNEFLEVSSDTQQALLELVCFYNNQDDIEDDWIEERWYTQANKEKEGIRNTWKYVLHYYNIIHNI